MPDPRALVHLLLFFRQIRLFPEKHRAEYTGVVFLHQFKQAICRLLLERIEDTPEPVKMAVCHCDQICE